MRRNLLKLVLTCLLLMGGLATSRAQTTPILSYSDAWQYLITNGLPQGGWTNINYPPGDAWFFGGSVFSFPIDEPMPTPFASVQTLLSTNYLSTIVTSFYFRTSIILTQNFGSNVVINASAIVDDGAVVYLNGREVTRIRMPTGNINYNTLANAGGEVASRIDSFSIPGTNFIRGTNVMAVEVHQDLHTSSDVVFGMQLTPTTIDPVSITNGHPSPPLQTVDTGHRTTLSVGAWGTSVRYQWYSNNVPVTGATSWSYQTPAFGSANTGIVYHVVASNALNSIRSSNAVVVVETDRNGPVITQVRTDGAASNRLLLTFDEPIAQPAVFPGVTNINNYSVMVLGTTNRIAITNVQFGSVTLIRLFLAERVTSTNEYVICASGIPDAKTNFAGNTCATFDKVAISNLFTLGSIWRFHNLAADLSTENWTSPNYDDGPNQSWGAGTGPLHFDPSVAFPPANACYDVSGGSSTGKGPRTFYYRKRLTFTQATVPTNTMTLNVRHAIDDGAVIYINGQEIQRIGMPAAPSVVNYSTIATRTVVDALCETFTVEVPRGLFRVGTNNVVAVEVHQQEGNPSTEAESDNLFDMELSFQRDIAIIPVSRLTITRGTGNVLVTWTGGTNFMVEATTNLSTGPWLPITPNVGNNGYRTTPTAGQQQFFRAHYP
jgi:hypothetical protein